MENHTKQQFIWDDEAVEVIGDKGTRISRFEGLAKRIITALHGHIDRGPTRDELQRLAGIKRCDFIPALKLLVADGIVFRKNAGTKGSPYQYFPS